MNLKYIMFQCAKLVSAGFIDSDDLMPFGESESLKNLKLPCAPLKDDYKIFQTYDFLHGVTA